MPTWTATSASKGSMSRTRGEQRRGSGSQQKSGLVESKDPLRQPRRGLDKPTVREDEQLPGRLVERRVVEDHAAISLHNCRANEREICAKAGDA